MGRLLAEVLEKIDNDPATECEPVWFARFEAGFLVDGMYKIGRNELCPCGSGRKYKQCCLSNPAANEKILHAASKVTSREELVTLLKRPARICRLRVVLDSIRLQEPDEDVCRTIEIEDEDTLYDLHLAIQSAFDWDNDHLYSFYMSDEIRDLQSEYAGDPMGDDVDSTRLRTPKSAANTELQDLGLERGMQFKYLFDYGDDLIHTLQVIDIHDRTDDTQRYPRVVEKIGEPPPQYEYFEE